MPTAFTYTAGQVTLTNGSTTVVGVGTAWKLAGIPGGIIFAEGLALPLASVASDTLAVASIEWAGATGTYDYALVLTVYSQENMQNSTILTRLLAELDAGTVWKYDTAGTSADRALYDTKPQGFSYLAIDGTQPQLYIKASATDGDWNGPFAYGVGPAGPLPLIEFQPTITGAPGTNASLNVSGSGEADDPYELAFTVPAGEIGITWRGAYSSATAYEARDSVLDNGSTWIALQATTGNAPPVLPTTSNAYWSLIAAKGADGTGTGDVVGPGSAGADTIPLFSGTTGKVLKSATVLQAMAALGPVFGGAGVIPSAAGVGLTDGDLNTIIVAGMYTIAGTWSNNPVGTGTGVITGMLIVTKRSFNNGYWQKLIINGRAWTRYNSTSGGLTGWSDWLRVDVPVLGTPSSDLNASAGAIFGRGSNANGEYIRFADGTQICWIQSIDATYNVGSVLDATWTFPAAFATTSIVGALSLIDFSAVAGANGNARKGLPVFVPQSASAARVGTFADPTSFVSGDVHKYHVTAFGRWF